MKLSLTTSMKTIKKHSMGVQENGKKQNMKSPSKVYENCFKNVSFFQNVSRKLSLFLFKHKFSLVWFSLAFFLFFYNSLSQTLSSSLWLLITTSSLTWMFCTPLNFFKVLGDNLPSTLPEGTFC